MKVASLGIFFAAFFSGCGMISGAIVSDEELLDKAETATGIARSNLSIVSESKDPSIDAVNYQVTDREGNLYKCYYTSIVAVDSDAICTKISKDGTAQPANSGNCNALLRAAGKCK